MTTHAYTPGPATGAEVRKKGERWTLILTRQLRHAPEKVWAALIDPAQLGAWAPFDVDGPLQVGKTVNVTWVGTQYPIPTEVKRADEPELLEFGDMRWQLEPHDGGTRLTLWHDIDRRYVSWGAAGWHIGLDALAMQLDGTPMPRLGGGAENMKNEGWQRLVKEYAQQFGGGQ
jgi:uncharacterized protein YndB with AHSA1/START domain